MLEESIAGSRNFQAYSDVFKLEVGLREFISECFSKNFGSDWIENHSGPAAKINVSCRETKNGQKAYTNLRGKVDYVRDSELQKGWNDDLVSVISGMYFLLWTELVSCIDQDWTRLVGRSESDIFQLKPAAIKAICHSMRELNTIRNKVAHSMLLTARDCRHLEFHKSVIYDYLKIEDYYLRACQIEELIPDIHKCILEMYHIISNDGEVGESLSKLSSFKEKIRGRNDYNISEVIVIAEKYNKNCFLAGRYEILENCKIELTKILSNYEKSF